MSRTVDTLCTIIQYLLYHIETHYKTPWLLGVTTGPEPPRGKRVMCFYMVGRIGFEPMTNRLKVYCSTN
jgi:hypothetical protein